jgi:hypothetical protein
MHHPPENFSPIGRKWFLLLSAVRTAAVNLVNTSDRHDGKFRVCSDEFDLLVQAISRLAAFEDSMTQ